MIKIIFKKIYNNNKCILRNYPIDIIEKENLLKQARIRK